MSKDRRSRISIAAFIALASLVVLSSEPLAQGNVLPGSEQPELEPFPKPDEREGAEPAPLELPALPRPEGREGQLAAGLRVFVREFRVEGSSVFSAEELDALTAPWTGREIDSEDLLRVRDAITQHYVERGYLTSGALIPDQSVADGIVTVQIVEGTLAEIEVRGTHRFRPGYFETRLRWAGRAPVNVQRLEEQLQLFQRNPQVRRVHARLESGARIGESVLLLQVEENRFYGLTLEFSNGSSPAVGAYTGTFAPVLWNLIGWGDEWHTTVEVAEGLTEVDASVALPLPPFDTRFDLHFQYAENEVVESPFDPLDIKNESFTYGFTVRQPVWRSDLQQIHTGVTGEYRTSDTRVLGECFAFVPETAGCKAKVSVVRLFADWVLATPSDVVAARSMLSVGVHALGSTDRSGGLPDSEYLAWLGQLQWAHRLPRPLLESELLFRVDAQLADDRLLGIEKFAVGGMRTVRGYRENQLVRDNGVVASGELRVPLWRDPHGRPIVQIAPFVDYGRSWDHDEGGDARTLVSVGVGLRLSPWEWLRGEIYWGHAFKRVRDPGGDLQDDGILFELTLVPF